MDNKKQQNYSGVGNSKTSNQSTDSNRQKSFSDIQTTKHWPRNSRRRENPTSARNNSNNNTKHFTAKVRPNVDKRPRARGNNNNNDAGSSYRYTNENCFTTGPGLESENITFWDPFVEEEAGRSGHTDYGLNSVFTPRRKKQNLNHLFNFYYTPREVDVYDNFGGGNNGNVTRLGHAKKHKYNKEQFLQANFQFVIKASAKRKTDCSPDTLIDWALIEQINIQIPGEQQCPICLYPPVAAKVTRCGHVYCWPCVLHYLSLTDKTWRKCPICYDAIHLEDLKSASITQQQEFNINSNITFLLMRRKKDSLFIEKYDKQNGEIIEKYPYINSPMEEKLFSKFILAKRNDVVDIMEREERELLTNVDESCPEYVFIQQALELLRKRKEKFCEIEQKDDKNKSEENETIDDNINVIGQVEQFPNNDVEKNAKTNYILSINNHPYNFEEKTYESLSVKKSSNKYYYFYQSNDGQNIFLHPLNVKMLQACYGSLEEAPSVISARMIQREQHSMDEDYRRKFTCLGHLPLTCQFAVVEIELQPPYVTEDIIQAFRNDILLRKKERQRRAMEEHKRERHINAINERQMGKIIASTANINITSAHEFPTCGFEESLVSSGDFDGADNVPSTSKGGRTKTLSTSSAGSCSYSTIALHCKKEDTPWSTFNAAQKEHTSSLTLKIVDPTEFDGGETSVLNTTHTNLGDVLAQALSQKKERKSTMKTRETNHSVSTETCGNKKSKKSKKMLPLYSTGMNFNGK